MIISGKQDFITLLKSFKISSEYVIIKPNWVNNQEGNFTEAEILQWLFEALPQKKIVIESYTPWRGLKYSGNLETNLEGGKKYWDFYKKQDESFLKETGIGEVLKKFRAQYLNITDEYWRGEMVNPEIIQDLLKKDYPDIYWKDLCSYIPQKLFEIKDKSTLISLAKIKLEEKNPQIVVSLSIKNLFGLIPHPSRKNPYHEDSHLLIPQAISDIYKIYTTIFPKNFWISEGIFSLVKNYCEEEQYFQKNQRLLFAGENGKEVDSQVCQIFKINLKSVPYLS